RVLGLSQDWGCIVSDRLPEGPADAAGVRAQDIIVKIDDRPVDSLPLVAFYMYTRKAGDQVKLTIVRGEEELVLNVPVIERRDDVDRLADLVDPEKSRVQQLGVVCVDI